MWQYLKGLTRAVLAEWGQFFEDTLIYQDPQVKMGNQLRSMYGRGELSSERFLALHVKLDRNQIGQGDITLIQRESDRNQRLQGKTSGRAHDPQVARSLDRLYVDRGLLEEARAEIEASLQSLATESQWVHEQIGQARREAQAALPDEDKARGFLEARLRLMDLASVYEKRLKVLEGHLGRIQSLEVDLRSAITTLKLLDAQEQTVSLNLAIHHDLIAQAQRK